MGLATSVAFYAGAVSADKSFVVESLVPETSRFFKLDLSVRFLRGPELSYSWKTSAVFYSSRVLTLGLLSDSYLRSYFGRLACSEMPEFLGSRSGFFNVVVEALTPIFDLALI